MGEIIKVGMADLNVCCTPDAITTLGLGSCVGVALYDKATQIAGLVHVMLPDSKQVKQNQNRAKFADTGIDMLRVGDRNVEAVKKRLKELDIRILAEDTGLNYGRTVVFYPESGDFVIKSVGKPIRTI